MVDFIACSSCLEINVGYLHSVDVKHTCQVSSAAFCREDILHMSLQNINVKLAHSTYHTNILCASSIRDSRAGLQSKFTSLWPAVDSKSTSQWPAGININININNVMSMTLISFALALSDVRASRIPRLYAELDLLNRKFATHWPADIRDGITRWP